jgi:hypothetical protein
MHHGIVGDLLVAKSLEDKCVSTEVKLMIGNIEDLPEIWTILDVYYEHPEK